MLKTKDITLRDLIPSDIKKRIYWETTETEWQLWDGPWLYEKMDPATKEKELQNYITLLQRRIEQSAELTKGPKRQFQIATNSPDSQYIGWVSGYKIDNKYNITTHAGHYAVGITIPDQSARGKGYAYQALSLYINYLLEYNETDLYLQTWSGNHRMIHIAEKLGFEEYCRKKNIRTVRGQKYDGLTFKLNLETFTHFKATHNLD